MLIISPQTAHAMAPHTGERSCVMFVQTTPPSGTAGPIWIDAVPGSQIGSQLDKFARYSAYPTFLIGLVDTASPKETAQAIREQYAGKCLHDYWYEPSADLIAYILHVAQAPIRALLEQTHPGALSTATVDTEELARILNCSERTVRRMVEANQIPYMRWGRGYRFVPAEVIASLQRQQR